MVELPWRKIIQQVLCNVKGNIYKELSLTEEVTFCLTSWFYKGYVIRVDDYRESLYKFLHHAATMLVKMDPSESEVYPDLMLAFDTHRADEYGDVLADLNRGDAFGFNGTLMSLGTHS